MCFQKDLKRYLNNKTEKRVCGLRVCLQYTTSDTFLDKCSFLKQIKKTYVFMIISLLP